MSAFTEVPSAPDRRFRRRSVYWRPGMSVISEPWVVLAETNTGHVVVPCGRDAGRALALLHRWHAVATSAHPVDVAGRLRTAAAVVDPTGLVRESWALDGDPPEPGGRPRWTPLHRLLVEQACRGCGEQRHPGMWVSLDPPGCALCLPERERDDPRPWPVEASAPPPPSSKRKPERKAAPDEAVASLPALASPSGGRLL